MYKKSCSSNTPQELCRVVSQHCFKGFLGNFTHRKDPSKLVEFWGPWVGISKRLGVKLLVEYVILLMDFRQSINQFFVYICVTRENTFLVDPGVV